MGRKSRRRSAAARRPRTLPQARTGGRHTLASWGGLPVIGSIAVAVVVLAVFLFRQPLGFARSDDPLLGEVYADVSGGHVEEGALGAAGSQPPAGGPHYTRPASPGVFDEPIAEGYLIHSLEHGLIWLAYDPVLLETDQLSALESLASEYDNDVVLAPRPDNDATLYAMSWGRRMAIDPADEQRLRAFIETNRNRSPEPGIR